ncbi:hypothetical protein V6N11_032766 [Hibiscus sabdariffa]|uniref:Protein kinase domain-containing protein n=1 Tax=Hibiscus sabdariffa TaxID=183260 RepID=A0ABR2T1K7_9ROSI
MCCFSCCGLEVQHHSGSLKESGYGIGGNGSNKNIGKSLRSLLNNLSSKRGSGKQKIAEEIQQVGKAKVSAHIFTFRELVVATDNFNPDCLIGEGQLTTKSDVYSFGVVFLELISGRRAIDIERPEEEQNLVAWAEPLLKDRQKFSMIADPLLQENYPAKALFQALAVAAMCLQEDADNRPLIGDVVTAVEFLAKPKDDVKIAAKLQRNNGLQC